MKQIPRWLEAQKTERDFWVGIARNDAAILRVIADNAEKASRVRNVIAGGLTRCLEIGVGPIGLGIIGFLPQIPNRYALDPLQPVPLDAQDDRDNSLRDFIMRRRSDIYYIIARGEEIPMRSDTMDLVVCCNVIDHASDPDAILGEIHRVLKPEGQFFFDVDTFSVLGLAKWHTWTKYAHRHEVLVRAHPHRMFESDMTRKLQARGFRLQKLHGHTFVSNLIGHARASTFLGTKCAV
jgi:SAM-dependent methyltransferase